MYFYTKLLIIFAVFCGFWYYWFNNSDTLQQMKTEVTVYDVTFDLIFWSPIIVFTIFLLLEYAISFI